MPGKIFAIGDIHGCFRNLTALMADLPFDPQQDTLVFLGDYINRGPASREVIDYLLTLRSQCAHTVFLIGNHEHLLLEYAASGDVDMLHLLRSMGVEATLKSYGDASVRSLLDLSFLPPAHLDFLQTLAVSYPSPPYLFVHADADMDDGKASGLDQLLSSRRLTHQETPSDRHVMVFGHTALLTPLVTPDRIGIDTGAVHGNVLTALELPNVRFYYA